MKDSITVRLPGGPTARAVELPADCLVPLLLAVVADAVLVWTPAAPGALRVGAGLLVLFVLPGYAVQAALFPRAGGAGDAAGEGLPARLALSFGLSLAALPLVGVALDVSGVGLGARAFVGALTGLVAAGLVAAVVRRNRLPPGERFRLRDDAWLGSLRLPSGGLGSRLGSVALAVAVVAAVATAGLAVTTPAGGESYTSTALLAENESGDLVASGYPTSVPAGGSAPLVLAVENHESATTSYTVVVQLQRVAANGTVTERAELDRLDATVAAGERWVEPHTVRPTMTGTDLRLFYLVYRGDAPAAPTDATAYRSVYVWLDVPANATAE
ncbi:DUF1616 domain-containing protein [Halosegnis marinus]|uniref:DUF1616 domain-containing protein n=1 Tax=Halosegnis marinus TaxID=3034023 RepID=A0ABD5ZS14_9EURY|nr:DUF1616 domain-containing protein [Halosegnis sp. DT85]